MYLQGMKMTFEPSRGAPAEGGPKEDDAERIYVPGENDERGQSLAAHHVDSKLQTRLPLERLQKRLLSLFREAKSLEEEQGISVLFLAMGFLCWYESESSDTERFAPLILLPVDLQRETARSRFRLEFRDQELETNLSLQAMLASDFDLQLPAIPEGGRWLPSEYFDLVRAAVSSPVALARRARHDGVELLFVRQVPDVARSRPGPGVGGRLGVRGQPAHRGSARERLRVQRQHLRPGREPRPAIPRSPGTQAHSGCRRLAGPSHRRGARR